MSADQPTIEQRKMVARQRRAEQEVLVAAALGPDPEPVWCPVANVVRERPYGPGGAETKFGLRQLKANAKVYVFDHLWDSHSADASLMVIGHHRFTNRYISIVVAAKWLTNWRVELAYSPHVIREFMRVHIELFWWNSESTDENLRRLCALTWNGTPESKARAERMVALMREVFPERAGGLAEGKDADRREP